MSILDNKKNISTKITWQLPHATISKNRGFTRTYLIFFAIFIIFCIVALEFIQIDKLSVENHIPARSTISPHDIGQAMTIKKHILEYQQATTTKQLAVQKKQDISLIPKQALELAPAPKSTPASQPLHIIETEPIPVTLFPIEQINASARKALVNIICTAKNSGVFMPVSGSGVIIDPRGIILTNAHIANVYLLKDYPVSGFVDCIIRSGSPARNMYHAELLYISSVWIKQNKTNLIEENPTGTGENDFALLRITDTVSGDPLPSEFSYVSYELEEANIEEGQSVLLVGYPASFLGGITIQKDLHITSTVSTITKLYTFDQSGLLDLISVGTSVLAQKGSSGGAVIRQQSDKLTGLIVTSTSGKTTDDRELNAITIAHINRSFKKETGFDLASFLQADLLTVAHDFQTIIGTGLTQMLIDVVEHR